METGEHIYDMPQLSSSQKYPNPSVMPKPFPGAGGMAEPLLVNTTHELVVATQAEPASPGRKGRKKTPPPPPPPKPTHSIRRETSSISESPQGSPSKAALAPATMTVSASVHPQPTTSKQPPPPVMQKPKKPLSPAVVNNLHQQHSQHHSQQHQQQPLNPPVAQKSQMPLVQEPKMVVPPAPHPHVHSSGPVQQPSMVSKPVVTAQQPHMQQQAQPKSPLPSKSPMAPTMTDVAQRQQQHQHHQPLSHSSHTGGVREQGHLVSSSHSTTPQQQPISQASAPMPSQHLGHSPAVQQPQIQAFASCVKSLSEKFGKNNKEDDQFPDNDSTDSDDISPSLPPIAMDIITPKVHNYGIPSSRDRENSDYSRPHQHPQELAHESHINPAGARTYGAGGGRHDAHQKNLQRPPDHNLQSAVMTAPAKAMPGQNTGLQPNRSQSNLASNSSSPSSSDHEHTPVPDAVNKISSEERSESTTSFEPNSSSPSVDSNTLPFATENVGTIKQRVGNVKPSIVQPVNMENGQRNLDLNSNLIDNESQRTAAGFSNSSLYLSPSSYSHITSSAAVSSSSKNSVYSSSPGHQAAQQPHYHHQQQQQQQQMQQQEEYQHQLSNASSTSSLGTIKPLVPSEKPVLSPKPKADSSSPPSSQSPPPPQKQQPTPQMPAPQQPVPQQSEPLADGR